MSEIPRGAIRFNTDSNKPELWDGAQWAEFQLSTPNLGRGVDIQPGARGLFAGGYQPGAYQNDIDYINIASTGNTQDFGTLNNVFLETTDSSAPVFTRLTRMMTLIRDTATAGGGSSALAIGTAAVRYSNSQLVTFLATLVADSTDFQTSLDNAVSQAAGNYSSLNTRISDALAGDPISELQAIREEINVQVALENSNLTDILTYVDTLSSNLSYSALAEDTELRKLMANVAQDTNWQTYFNDYEANQANLNPIYDTDTDSDKSAVIDQVLADSGLPDVTDSTDFQAVAGKAKRDSRIDTANFDRFTVEQIIQKSCVQLGITTANRTISALSKSLLSNMNQHDRDTIASQLDLNESADTIS